MNADEDPYEVLGIDPGASDSQIKSAYRKAALQNHPDKQRTEQDRERATEQFTRISNAYEVLSDPAQKRRYDALRNNHNNFGDAPSQQYYNNDPDDDFRAFHRHFHDPFQLFEQVFREEFGRPSRGGGGSFRRSDGFFDDEFMMDPFFGGSRGSLFGGRESVFDSFFGGSSSPSSRRSMSRREQRHRDPFEEMRRMQQDMMQQMQQQGQERSNNNNGSSSSYFYSSSSSSSNAMRGGEAVTERTTTRMINGKQQTVKERIVRKADGTVDRQVDTSGDDDFPQALEAASGGAAPSLRGFLENNSDEQQQQQRLPTEEPLPDESAGASRKRHSKRRGWFGR